MVDDVQYWVTNQAGNFGWLLVCQAESTSSSVLGFASREAGASGPSLVIGYTPLPASNSPPLVSIISPTNGASFTAPATLTLEASASDLDGTVTYVQFFDGATLLGNVPNEPYRITVGLFPGTHVFSATATDNLGATDLATVTVAVTAPLPNNTPPTAAISSSASVGASPLDLQFDGVR